MFIQDYCRPLDEIEKTKEEFEKIVNSNLKGSKTLDALARKISNMIFNRGMGESIIPFLVNMDEPKRLKQDKNQWGPSDSNKYPFGHFRWDYKAYTLTDNELSIVKTFVRDFVYNEYEEQAETFLKETKTELRTFFNRYDKYFKEDEQRRNIYTCILSNHKYSYTFEFGDSIQSTAKNKPLDRYSVLSCLNIDYSEDFEDFCDNYGYEKDSRNAEKTYNAVKKESEALQQLFTEEQLEQLHEIQ